MKQTRHVRLHAQLVSTVIGMVEYAAVRSVVRRQEKI